MKWLIHNNANHGTRYGTFDTKDQAVAAAKERAESGDVDQIDEELRIVYFRRNPAL